jgi:hypothetical protein
MDSEGLGRGNDVPFAAMPPKNLLAKGARKIALASTEGLI